MYLVPWPFKNVLQMNALRMKDRLFHPCKPSAFYYALVLCRGLLFGFIEGGMGKAFFARGDVRSNTGKSRCTPKLIRGTSGLTHATRMLSCDKALVWCILAFPGFAVGDQVTVGAEVYLNVSIVSFQQGKLIFRTPRGQDIESFIRDVDFIMVSRGRRFTDFNQAEQYLHDDEPARAIPRYQRAFRTADSFWQDLFFARAIIASDRAGRIEQAIRFWIILAESDQSGVAAAVQLLPSHFQDNRRQDMDRAILQLTKAAAKQRKPDLAMLFQLLQYRLLDAISDNRMDEVAHTVLVSDWSDNLNYTEVYDMLIDVLNHTMRSEVTQESLARLDQALAVAPTDILSRLLLLKGYALLRIQEEPGSEVSAGWAFMRVVAHMPDSPDAAEGLYGAALAMEKLGRVDKSVSLLQECRDHQYASAAIKAQAEKMLRRLQSVRETAG